MSFTGALEHACRRVISDPASLKVYETDGLTARRQVPGWVVLPETLAEVQAVLRLCHREGVPVVPRGAGTGLSGGALPLADGVLLGLARFNRILEVDPVNCIARVEPGVTNLAISKAAAPHGLYYAPDPSSQLACTIGGNVAENAGGVHCLKYGLTVHNVTGLKVLLADGELVTIDGATPGPGLLALMHGSEGLLGVVMEVTVQLRVKPEHTVVVLAGFAAPAVAGGCVADIIGSGLLPAGLEMMDHLALVAAEDFAGAGYPRDAGAILLCELDGSEVEVASDLEKLQGILGQHGADPVQVSQSEADRARLWQGRKSAFPAVGRIAPDYYCMDGTIPRHQLADVLTTISELSEEYGLSVANVFHAGDGNLHPLILYDANQPGEVQRAEALGSAILTACIDAGGTITGEHGVGVEKLNEMCLQFSEDELQLFHAIKAAFDPAGILNPGKAVPTLNRCAEFGAMHVKGGHDRHPGLERF